MLLKELFHIHNGLPSDKVSISEKQTSEYSLPYVRPSSVYDNVIAGYLNPLQIDSKYIFEKDEIFVSTDGQGSHSYAYVSAFRFVPNSNVAVLRPKKSMDVKTKIFYALCITKNRYKFSYGRKPKGNRLANIELPIGPPKGFLDVNMDDVEGVEQSIHNIQVPILKAKDWQLFSYSELFDIKKGKRLTKENMDEGDTPFVASIDSNNGWREFIGQNPIHDANTITVNYNGSVGEAFYQPFPFWASDDVNVLYPKFELNVYIGIFIATVIRYEKYRFNYGRKWNKERMEESVIKLPAKGGLPDFKWMEDYIKSLPFSSALLKKYGEIRQRPKEVKGAIVKQKGLSDDELIRKYEAGAIDMKKAVQSMLFEPKK